MAPDGQGAGVPQCPRHCTGPGLKDSGRTVKVCEGEEGKWGGREKVLLGNGLCHQPWTGRAYRRVQGWGFIMITFLDLGQFGSLLPLLLYRHLFLSYH